jgi:hypothetical protein
MKKRLKALIKYVFLDDIEKHKKKLQSEIEEIKKLEEVRKKIDSKYN